MMDNRKQIPLVAARVDPIGPAPTCLGNVDNVPEELHVRGWIVVDMKREWAKLIKFGT